ncbi:MAG: LytTR family DNA-binding domain-containing protein [Sarcina sp.]
MKLTIEIDDTLDDEIVIKCANVTDEITNILSLFRQDEKLLVKNKLEKKFIDFSSIYRVDTVDDKVFIYTEKDIYESNYKIYQLNNLLPSDRFIRINKAAIINVLKVEKLKTDLNRRIKVTLTNGDIEIVNRTYVEEFKSLINDIKRRIVNEKTL